MDKRGARVQALAHARDFCISMVPWQTRCGKVCHRIEADLQVRNRAILVEHLEGLCDHQTEDSSIGIAYAFFDYKKATSSDHEALVKSILFQLCVRLKGNYPDCVARLSERENPTFGDFQATLQTLLGSFDDIHIVVDALEECISACQSTVLEMFAGLLTHTQGRNGNSRVRILLTSRKTAEIEDFYSTQDHLISCFGMEIRATDEDIRCYINSTIEEHEKQRKQDGEPTPLLDDKMLRKKTIDALAEKSEGMFLWAKLQLARLKQLEKSPEIVEFIRKLPADEYLQMVGRIKSLPENEERIAQRCLFWVTYAAVPLNQYELTAAIDIDDGKPLSPPGRIGLILRLCANFLELEEATGHIVFVHFSAVEFFKSQPSTATVKSGLGHYFRDQSAAQLDLAKSCIKYLHRSFNEDKSTSAISDMEWFLVTHQLAFYASHYFDYHLKEVDHIDEQTKELVGLFLSYENAALVGFMLIRTLESDWDAYGYDNEVKFWPGQVSKEPIVRITALNMIQEFRLPVRTPREEIELNGWVLHHAAFSGDMALVRAILQNAPPEFINRTDARGGTALYYAARQGSVPICQVLIDMGHIHPDTGTRFSNPLQVAALSGHLGVVKLLLERGANARLVGGFHNTPLQAAAWGEHYAIVHELLKSGRDKIDVNAFASGSARTYCALQAAAYRGNDSIVLRLIKEEAAVDIPEPDETEFGLPLQAAMHAGHISTAAILLGNGADINAESGTRGVAGTAATALQAAAWGGYREAVKFLINQGADVMQIAGTHGSALHVALVRGRKEIVDILIERGADIHERVGKYDNSLQAAATSGNEQLVRLVLNKGIDVNLKGGYFDSALIAAAQRGSLPVVTMLVEAGADLEVFNHNYGTALDAAAYGHSPNIVRPEVELAEELIARGAGVNSTGRSPYKVALQAAAWGRRPEMVRLLLGKGANVHFKGGVYGNALHAAVYSGSLEFVKLLIEAGADPNDPTGEMPSGTPLQCACLQVHEDVARFLLDHGTTPNTKICGECGTALQAAVVKNYEQMVTLLLDQGAEVNAIGGKFGTALQAAAFNGNLELATLLTKRGAKVDVPGGDYGTALQAAAYKGDPRIVEYLFQKGADPNVKGGMFGRALQAAAYSGNEAVVCLLLKNGADVNAVTKRKYGTALEAATHKGHETIVRILSEHGAEIRGGKEGGPTAATKKLAIESSRITQSYPEVNSPLENDNP